VANKFDLI